MDKDKFRETTIGSIYLKNLKDSMDSNKFLYPIEAYWDYLKQVIELKKDMPENKVWQEKCNREIEASGRIINKLTKLTE